MHEKDIAVVYSFVQMKKHTNSVVLNMQTVSTYIEVFMMQCYGNSFVTSFMLKILN